MKGGRAELKAQNGLKRESAAPSRAALIKSSLLRITCYAASAERTSALTCLSLSLSLSLSRSRSKRRSVKRAHHRLGSSYANLGQHRYLDIEAGWKRLKDCTSGQSGGFCGKAPRTRRGLETPTSTTTLSLSLSRSLLLKREGESGSGVWYTCAFVHNVLC